MSSKFELLSAILSGILAPQQTKFTDRMLLDRTLTALLKVLPQDQRHPMRADSIPTPEVGFWPKAASLNDEGRGPARPPAGS